jgi:hypothetical protein
MLAIPAPATLETNRRRDIVIESSPNSTNRISAFGDLIDRTIYRTEVVNDQVITTASIWRADIFAAPG